MVSHGGDERNKSLSLGLKLIEHREKCVPTVVAGIHGVVVGDITTDDNCIKFWEVCECWGQIFSLLRITYFVSKKKFWYQYFSLFLTINENKIFLLHVKNNTELDPILISTKNLQFHFLILANFSWRILFYQKIFHFQSWLDCLIKLAYSKIKFIILNKEKIINLSGGTRFFFSFLKRFRHTSF